MRKAKPHQEDMHYIHNKSAAMLQREERYTRGVIWVFILFVGSLVYWMYISQIDKLTRGIGKVAPSLETQYIQSYDGGIISKIFVKNGDIIHPGDPIVRINDADFQSRYLGNRADIVALKSKSLRLYAEATDTSFDLTKNKDQALREKLRFEKILYDDRQKTIKKQIGILKEKIEGKYIELESVKAEAENLEKQIILAKESVDISARMLKQKVTSRLQYNEQLKQLNSVEGETRRKHSQIVRIESEIKILQEEIKHTKLSFRSKARAELEDINAKLERLQESKNIDKGRIERALVKSPVSGVVKQMHYNTIGGVIKPGDVIAEIVPTKEHLIIDTKIGPSKIAFIYVGQKANIRFSAYDFAIYGMLKGEVISISADTSMDKYNKKSFYTVRVKTDRNYLVKNKKHLPIKIGMTATVDIMNGKQTVLQYLLNPIIKAKQNMLSNN